MPSRDILIVEDERIIARHLAQQLTGLGYTVALVTSGQAAIDRARTRRPDLVVMDVSLPGDLDGLAAAAQLWAELQIPVVYCSGATEASLLSRVRIPPPLRWLRKPFTPQELQAVVAQVLECRTSALPPDTPGEPVADDPKTPAQQLGL